jgi:hypothetical protein
MMKGFIVFSHSARTSRNALNLTYLNGSERNKTSNEEAVTSPFYVLFMLTGQVKV